MRGGGGGPPPPASVVTIAWSGSNPPPAPRPSRARRGDEVRPFDYETIPVGFYDQVCRRRRGVQAKWHDIEFDTVRAEIGDLAPLLDVGCGPGTFLGTLPGDRECVGLDVAAAQIDYATRAYASPRRTFRTMQGDRLPVDDGAFRCVTMIEVIEHIHDTDAALREMVRVAAPGGRVVVTTPNYASHWPLLEWLVGRLSPVDYRHQHVSHFDARRLEESMRRAGLRDVRVRSFMRIAPFAAAVSWRLADGVLRLDRRVPLVPGALLIGVGERA
jgi:SAM-dependent methyltransferase